MATVTRNKLALFQWLDNKDLHVVQGALNLTNHAGTASQNHSSLDLILPHPWRRAPCACETQAEKYMYITDVPARVCRFHSGPASAAFTVKSGGGGRKSTHFPALQGTATAAGNVTGSLSVSSADSDDAHRNKKTWQPWPTHSPFPSMEMIRERCRIQRLHGPTALK